MKDKKIYISLNLAKISFTVIIVSISVFLFFAFRPMLKPILISLILSYLFTPFVTFTKHKNIPKPVSIGLLFLSISVILIYIIYLIKLSFPSFNEFSLLFDKILLGLKDLKIILVERYSFIDWDSIFDNILLKLSNSTKLANNFSKILKNISSISSMLLTIPFATFFFLLDSKKFLDSILKIIPNKYYEITYTTIHDVDKIFGNYMRGSILESLIISFLTFIGLSIIGFPLGINIIISFISGLTNIIPYVGPFFGAVAALAVYFFNLIPADFTSIVGISTTALNITLVYVIVQTIDNIFLKPIILGGNVNLHPIIVIFSVIAGAKLFGFFGILLAIPAVAAIKILSITLYSKMRSYQLFSEKVIQIISTEK